VKSPSVAKSLFKLALIDDVVRSAESHILKTGFLGTWPNRLVAVPGGFGIKVPIQSFPVEMFYALRH
jgi:hypothetical protein